MYRRAGDVRRTFKPYVQGGDGDFPEKIYQQGAGWPGHVPFANYEHEGVRGGGAGGDSRLPIFYAGV